MADNARGLVSQVVNNAGSYLRVGEFVRIIGNSVVGRAQSPGALSGVIGAVQVGMPVSGAGNVYTLGEAVVELESGLTPVAGQVLYISAATAGRATNVAPGTAFIVGFVKDARGYTNASPFVVAFLTEFGVPSSGLNKPSVLKYGGEIPAGGGESQPILLGDVGAVVLAADGPLADAGHPMPACTVRNVRINPWFNTMDGDTVFTFYKNNVSQFTMTIPAGSTTLATELATSIVFSANDTYMILADSNDSNTGVLDFAMTVEIIA